MSSSASSEPTLRLHVAVDGSDGWSGVRSDIAPDRTDGPLATLAGARDRLRILRREGRLTGPAEVLVQPGRYEQAEPLYFGPEDLGEADTPVSYRAAEGGEVRISGSKRVTGFGEATDGIIEVGLRAAGVSDLPLRQLFCNGEWLRPARYPNFDPANPASGGWAHVRGESVNVHSEGHGVADSFIWDDPRPAGWSNQADAEVVVLPRWNYKNDIVPLASHDPATGRMQLAKPAWCEIYPNDRFFVQHVLEELDQPGEWAVDRTAEVLRVYPLTEVDAQTVIETPMVDSVIVIEGAEPDDRDIWPEKDQWFPMQHYPDSYRHGFLTLHGFVIEGCSGDAVVIRHATQVRLVACQVRNAAGFGVRVVEGSHCTVVDCEVHSVGKGGVEAAGGMRRQMGSAPIGCGHQISNNYIHHFGLHLVSVAGASAVGVGVSITHNLIHDGPRWGIISRGNDHILDHNHIRHVCLESADTSAIYLVDRDLQLRGTKIRWNHIHDILGFDAIDGVWTSPAYAFGIYLDDYTSGCEVRGNVVHGTPRAGVYLHGGQDNVVEENLCLSRGRESLYLRREPPATELRTTGTHDQGLRRNTIRRNIFGHAACSVQAAQVTDPDGQVDLATHDQDQNLYLDEWVGVRVEDRTLSLADWQQLGFDRNGAVVPSDQVFEPDSLTLRSTGPAADLGITVPDLSQMGIQPSPDRPVWPVVEAPGVRERMAGKTLETVNPLSIKLPTFQS